MAKDVLNKSKLSKEEDRIKEKVLSCEHYKPANTYKLLNWVDSRFSDRWKFVISMYIITRVISLIYAPWTGVLSELCRLGTCLFIGYIYTCIFLPGYYMNMMMSMIRKLL